MNDRAKIPGAPVQDENWPLTEPQKKAAENLEQLMMPAAQNPTAHDCALRKDIIPGRRELGRMVA